LTEVWIENYKQHSIKTLARDMDYPKRILPAIGRMRLKDIKSDSDRLFTTWYGNPIHPDTVTAWFSDFLKKHRLRKVTLHSLRHTNATLMIAEDVDVCTVSKRLGHANTSTTLNIYAHALKSRDEEAAKKLDNIFSQTAIRKEIDSFCRIINID
jgi:integrase